MSFKISSLLKRDEADRTSAILLFIAASQLIIIIQDKIIDSLCTVVLFVALISELVWRGYFLQKKPNAPKLSRNEIIATRIYFVLCPIFLFSRAFFPQIFPTWTNIAILTILFLGLVYFALSTPTPKTSK
ncbi:MAG: hypothetical protein RR442_09400 [Muribaculaceae bacterium]